MKKRGLLAALAVLVLLVPAAGAHAGYPGIARYTDEASRMFWFVHIADSHIGHETSQDTENLEWATGEAFETIDPVFMVNTGDLTDGTDGGLIYGGPYQEEWDAYRAIVDANGMTPTNYYDPPGNHDHYNDGDLSYYLNNSVQGEATGQNQMSWRLDYDFGVYHFVGVSTCGNDGFPWPFDNAGLDADELAYIESELDANTDANLTFVFGHHPTLFFLYGTAAFVDLMQNYGVSVYGHGHIHDHTIYWNDGILRYRIRSLGKSEDNHIALYVVDNDGLAINQRDAGGWPLVVISAPLDAALGGTNPYAYPVSADYDANPIRALAFDADGIEQVSWQLQDGGWNAMEHVDGPLWTGTFDATAYEPGEVALEVLAEGAGGTDVHAIVFSLETTVCYDGLDNDGDFLVDYPEDPGCYSPSDTDEFNENTAPVADAGDDQSAAVAEIVWLNGEGSYDPDGQPLNYSWDFDANDGIGQDATGTRVQTAYHIAGQYTVTLTVDDGLGLTGTDTVLVTVTDDSDDDSGDDDADDDDSRGDDDEDSGCGC